MKVSQEKKKEIRRELIQSAVEVITEKGFRAATMREIAQRAGYGSATIYNYFPTKEKILYSYFHEKHDELIENLDRIDGFQEFSLKEKLQSQLETLLDIYLEDREFVQEAYKLLFDSPLHTLSEFIPIRDKFQASVRDFLKSAIENEEIPEHPIGGFIMNLYWDYAGIILLYWLRDDSEGFSNTSRLIDMTLDIIVEVVRGGIIPKVIDTLAFLFKSHIYNGIESLGRLFSQKKGFDELFRKFSEK